MLQAQLNRMGALFHLGRVVTSLRLLGGLVGSDDLGYGALATRQGEGFMETRLAAMLHWANRK